MMMIASYTNDADRHHDNDCIVNIVHALALYDAIFDTGSVAHFVVS